MLDGGFQSSFQLLPNSEASPNLQPALHNTEVIVAIGLKILGKLTTTNKLIHILMLLNGNRGNYPAFDLFAERFSFPLREDTLKKKFFLVVGPLRVEGG